MKVVALVSGGKDSCFNMMCAVADGHEIVALANLQPENADELDSYMYQTVGHQAIQYYADALGLPLFRRTIQGTPRVHTKNYDQPDQLDEVEDLYVLLSEIKEKIDFQAVAVGAILSEYQTLRVLNICKRLQLQSLAYLWRRNQRELLEEMVSVDLDAILIKVAALGLVPEKHLGRSVKELRGYLLDLEDKYGCNPCGEGGEYETLTLDCPLFSHRLVIDEAETVVVNADSVASVAYINPKVVRLEKKLNVDGTKSHRQLLEPYMHVFRNSIAKQVPAAF